MEGPVIPRFTFQWSGTTCPQCGKMLLVRLTRGRRVVSLAYGEFVAIDRQGYCPVHSKLPSARSAELARLVAPASNVAYDIIVHIGIARFIECRQLNEIQAELSRCHCIHIPVRTIGHLAQRFVAYFQVVHEQSVGMLRRDMRKRGGYILHVDGTCEEGSRVLLVCIDSISGQVLESRKITSESHEQVRRVLADVRRDWGVPLAIVHDLRTSLITAAAEIFIGVSQFVCHYHLAADVGKDILAPHVDRLRRMFRNTQVRPRLAALCRTLKPFAVPQDAVDHVVSSILACTADRQLQEQVTPEITKGVLHALISWILAFSRAGEGYGFPFDLPYLSFYERIERAHKVLERASAVWPPKTRGALAKLNRCKQILETVVTGKQGEDFKQVVAELRSDMRVFERFRVALRICLKAGRGRRNDDGAPDTLSSRRHKAILTELRRSLSRQAARTTTTKRACGIVIDHLDKYWPYLFGHVIRRRRVVVPRTNNVEERLFRTIKRQCRRIHGRGHLSRDVDSMPAGTALILNLRNASYCETVYGGTAHHNIVDRFSEVAPQLPGKLMTAWRRERHSTSIPRKIEAVPNLPERLARFVAVASDTLSQHP